MPASPRSYENPAALVDFESLYREHAPHVHRFVLFLSGDPELARDITSETFVRLWTARHRSEITTVRGYALAIARNLYLHDRRREARRHVIEWESLASGAPGPEESAAARIEMRSVRRALAELGESDRAALLMRAEEGLPYDEIAAALGISLTAAKVKVHRARQRLLRAREEKG